jgi:hypothetical protein
MGTRCPDIVQKVPSDVQPTVDVPVAHSVTVYGVQPGGDVGAWVDQWCKAAGTVGADGPATSTQAPPKES